MGHAAGTSLAILLHVLCDRYDSRCKIYWLQFINDPRNIDYIHFCFALSVDSEPNAQLSLDIS